MDSIEQFDVEVDISDRKRLYDYASCTLLKRPVSGIWDTANFARLGKKDNFPDEDKNGAQRIYLMDKSFHDKGARERRVKDKKKGEDGHQEEKKKEKEDKDDEGMIDEREDGALPRRVLPVYKPGDIVRGQVVLNLKEPLKAKSLKLNFKGYAHIQVPVYTSYGVYYVPKEEYYVKETLTLWQKSSRKGDETESMALHEAAGGPSLSEKLPGGLSKFPFSFVVPKSGRQSTPPLIPNLLIHGYIVYRLKAKIDKGHVVSAGNINSHKGLWIETPYNIAEDAANLQPVVKEKGLETGVMRKRGKITILASIPRRGVLIGEDVHLTLEIKNKSNGLITKAEARIRMTGKTKASAMKQCAISVKSVKKDVQNISAGMCPVYQWDLPWDFSESSVDGNLLPVGTLNDCSIIDIRYEVRVKISHKDAHRNKEVTLPICVGNTNSRRDYTLDPDSATVRIFYED